MRKIREEKNVEFLVNIRYRIEGEKLIQTFEFSSSSKKNFIYLFDPRFLFKNKIDNLLSEFLLKDFLQRIDEENKITFLYEKQEIPKNCIRKLSAYIPPCFGCEYCSKAIQENDFIFCPVKNKHYPFPGVKRCPVFKTKNKILT